MPVEADATTRIFHLAKGSLMETETYLVLAVPLNYLDQKDARQALAAITEISKMITPLRLRLLE